MRRACSGTRLFPFALGLLFASAGPARASTEYPAEIQKQLSLSYTPECSICHAGGDTDAGTATTPFADAMVSYGLMGDNNLPSLDGALAGLEAVNSPFISYLKEGVDPNNPSSGGVQPPTYGCFNMTGQGPSAATAGLFLLALVLLLRRRGLAARR